VVIWDVVEPADEVLRTHSHCTFMRCDVTDRGVVGELVERVERDVG
jgi:NAD(P)-dependent dehydrogenase (short-subunit alcohol dehydrogenase family)